MKFLANIKINEDVKGIFICVGIIFLWVSVYFIGKELVSSYANNEFEIEKFTQALTSGFGITAIIVSLVVGFCLITDKRSWVVLLLIAALGLLIGMIASIIYFQILWALGCFVLMIACWKAAGFIVR